MAVIKGTDICDFNLRSGDLEKMYEDLTNSASYLVKSVKKDKDPSLIVSILTDSQRGLATHGHLVLNQLFDRITRKGVNALDLLGSYMNDSEEDIPVVEINTNDFLIPWEWLYERPPQQLRDVSEFTVVVEPFWGCNRILMRRPLPKGRPLPTPLEFSQVPKVGLIVNTDLQFVDGEREHLYALKKAGKIVLDEFDREGVFRDWDLISNLNNFLQEDFDIVHIACHTGVDEANNLYFEFSGERRYLLNHLFSTPTISLENPLVFINSCWTGALSPRNTYSIVQRLWDRGASNIIALESEVESELASGFAQRFYENFLSGDQLGNSHRISVQIHLPILIRPQIQVQ